MAGLLQRFTESTRDEADAVIALRNEFPYCQVFQALAARVSQDHNLPDHPSILQAAATHSTDRSVLKEIMSYRSVTEPVEDDQFKAKQNIPSHDFAEEVFEDLQKLKHSKEAFESMFGTAGTIIQPLEKEPPPEKPKRESSKSKKQRIVEMARDLKRSTDSDLQDVKKEIKKPKKKASQTDPLIEAIKTSRKKIKPENEKAREQIDIINQFIKASPVISPSPSSTEISQQDMSASIRSGEFSDHIVSETLVEILLKQGKKDKAIEVLKKLIWKFPQKKTYFAARIDDLKK